MRRAAPHLLQRFQEFVCWRGACTRAAPMRIELAIVLAALSVLYVACFEIFERRTAADAPRLRTFRAVGGGMLALGTLALLAGALLERAPPALDQFAVAARGPVPAAMLVEQLVDLLGTLGVFF